MNLRSLFVAVSFLILLTRADDAAAKPATPATPASPAAPAPKKALPVAVAAPAFVESVTFRIENAGDKHVLTVISAPGLVRIDAPDDRLSVIYDPATEHYTGLEHSNYTYWEFTWPEVRDAVQNTQRYATRLRDLGPELLEENAITPPSADADASTNATPSPDLTTPPTTSSAGSDDTGYVWHTTPEKKSFAGYDCVHWVGETVAGEKIDAWCAPGLVPPIEDALKTLQTVNEPIALVPVRDFVPPMAFVAWKALTKGGVTPVFMTWGSDVEANKFSLENVKQREGKLSYFQVPKVYIKTTLVTMDGIGNQKPSGEQRGQPMPVKHDPLLNNL